MIIFLDVISPIPKFVIIDNNKVIESLHILDDNCEKISDTIHDKFLILQRKHNLLNLIISFSELVNESAKYFIFIFCAIL